MIARMHALGEEIGCRGLLVHAETAEARDFDLQRVPELEVSPTDELHRFLLMKDIRRTLAKKGGGQRLPSMTAGAEGALTGVLGD